MELRYTKYSPRFSLSDCTIDEALILISQREELPHRRFSTIRFDVFRRTAVFSHQQLFSPSPTTQTDSKLNFHFFWNTYSPLIIFGITYHLQKPIQNFSSALILPKNPTKKSSISFYRGHWHIIVRFPHVVQTEFWRCQPHFWSKLTFTKTQQKILQKILTIMAILNDNRELFKNLTTSLSSVFINRSSGDTLLIKKILDDLNKLNFRYPTVENASVRHMIY